MATRTPKNAFFEFFLREALTTPPTARPIYPRGGDPVPSAPGRTAHHRQQRRPCQNQGGQIPGQTMQGTTHTPGRWTRCTGLHPIPDRPRRVDRTGGGRWRVGDSSIMRIVIALSQAWYIDSNMNKYHKDILLFLVIVNYYLSIDIQPY